MCVRLNKKAPKAPFMRRDDPSKDMTQAQGHEHDPHITHKACKNVNPKCSEMPGSWVTHRHTQHVAELPIVFIHSAVSVVDGDALKYFRCTQLIAQAGAGS